MKSRITKTSKLFDNEWLKVYESSAIIRGKERNWTFSSRSNNPQKQNKAPDAVVIVPFVAGDHETLLLMTKEFRIPIGDYEYGLPAGLIDKGETPLDAAKRELLEETGYRVKDVLMYGPPNLYSSAGMSDESYQYVFVTAEYERHHQHGESEDIETLPVSLKQLKIILERQPPMSARTWPICFMYLQMGKFPVDLSKQTI